MPGEQGLTSHVGPFRLYGSRRRFKFSFSSLSLCFPHSLVSCTTFLLHQHSQLLLGPFPGLLNNRGMPLLNHPPNNLLHDHLPSPFSPFFQPLWPRYCPNLPFRHRPNTRFPQFP